MDTLYLRTRLLEKSDALEALINDELYRFQRYNIPFSISIFHSTHPLTAQFIREHVRKSDKVIELDQNFACVVFDCVAHSDAYKAAENMLHKLHNAYPHEQCSAGITSVNLTDEVKDMVTRSMNNLQMAMQRKESSVEDDNVIDYILPS